MVKNISWQIILITILLLGLGLRTYASWVQPIWLDEQYSLYLSSTSSVRSIVGGIFHANPLPYYILIKPFVLIISNLFWLRVLTSVLVSVLGIIMAVVHHRKNSLVALWLAVFLSLNPYFINLSWQLRMYAAIFAITCVVMIIIDRLKASYSRTTVNLLIVLLLVGNLLHYEFFVFSALVGLYLILQAKSSFRILVGRFLAILLMLMIQFIFLSGFDFKKPLEHLAWVEPASFESVPRVVLSSLGIVDSSSRLSMFSLLIFYSLMCTAVYYYVQVKQSNRRKVLSSQLFVLVLLPYLIGIISSILLPFMSRWPLLHHFIPNISLMTPRFYLPFAVTFCWIIAKVMVKPRVLVQSLLLVFLLIVWIFRNYRLNMVPSALGSQPSYLSKYYFSRPTEELIYFWPPWMLMTVVSEKNVLSTKDMFYRDFQLAEKFENYLHGHTIGSLDCRSFSSTKTLWYLDEGANYKFMTDDERKVNALVDKCCLLSQARDGVHIYDCQDKQ